MWLLSPARTLRRDCEGTLWHQQRRRHRWRRRCNACWAGAAGDVPAQAGRSLSDRAGDARRPLAWTLKQLGPPSRNRPTLGGLGLCCLLRPDPGAEAGRRLPPKRRGLRWPPRRSPSSFAMKMICAILNTYHPC